MVELIRNFFGFVSRVNQRGLVMVDVDLHPNEKMNVEERRLAILFEVQERERVNVVDLSGQFGVSQVIIRRDLENFKQPRFTQESSWGSICDQVHFAQIYFRSTITQKYHHQAPFRCCRRTVNLTWRHHSP